jgi:hypothetical protein
LDWEAAINNLEAETKRVMIATGKSYLKKKMEEPHSSNTPQIIMEMLNSLFTAPPAPQPPLPLCVPPAWPTNCRPHGCPASLSRPPTYLAGHLAASTASAYARNTYTVSNASAIVTPATRHGPTDKPDV